MLRNILAYLGGIVASFAIIAVIEAIGHVVYPPPENIDFSNREEFAAIVAAMPVGAILFVGVSWIAASLLGSLLAARLGTLRPIYFTSVITGLILAGAITNLIIIPHPLWFTVLSLAGIVAGGFAANKLAQRPRA